MLTHILVEGTSEAQDFQLTDDGLPLDGTGLEVGLMFSDDAVVDSGDVAVAWLSQPEGTIRLTETAALPVGSHKFRWTLTDNGGRVGFIPNLSASPNILRVVRV